MSTFYRKKNSESTKDLFGKKLIYNLKSKTQVNSDGIVDFTFAEKALYGRVDRLYIPMVVGNTDLMPVKMLRTSLGENIGALSFVVDAFEAMADQFLKKYSADEISRSEKYLSQIKAHKGYTPPIKKYDEYTEIFINAIGGIIRDKKIYFKDFDDFLGKILPNIKDAIKKYPITMSGFIKSRQCPMSVSGLTINISDLNFVDDSEKVKMFYDSANWEFYVNAASSYGFMIDRNNPSVLVADIGSAEMLKFAERYKLLTTDTVLKSAYVPAHANCLLQLREVLFKIYNKYKVKRYSTYVNISPNKSRSVTVTPRNYSYKQFENEYNDSQMLNLYCQFRFLEEESEYTDGQKFRIADDTIELSKNNLNDALAAFELIINKTFDYRGSLSYHKMRLDILRE